MDVHLTNPGLQAKLDRWVTETGRGLISERTRAGVKAAQRRAVKLGRKVKLTPEQIDHARELIDKCDARQYVADLLNMGRSTLYRALILRGEKKLKQFSVAVPDN
jgi:DNA invertase Pin-like site-specific DNA recombinase